MKLPGELEKERRTWKSIATQTNSGSSATNSTVTISDIEKYDEFLITVGTTSYSGGVLASTVIPAELFLVAYTRTNTKGEHRADFEGSYYVGATYKGSNSVYLYTGATSELNLYAR